MPPPVRPTRDRHSGVRSRALIIIPGMAHAVRFVLETQQHLQDRQGSTARLTNMERVI
jgi:hypothetical protein